MAARVAGVPMPQSFIACRITSSSTSLPAVSIAASRVASVWNGLGFVLPSVREQPIIGRMSPSFHSGRTTLSSPSSFSFLTERQPYCLTTFPFATNSTPPHPAFTVVTSLTHFPENASSIRATIMS